MRLYPDLHLPFRCSCTGALFVCKDSNDTNQIEMMCTTGSILDNSLLKLITKVFVFCK